MYAVVEQHIEKREAGRGAALCGRHGEEKNKGRKTKEERVRR